MGEPIAELLGGDCLAVMPTLPEASVETVLTDPPYELGFMGKRWDSTGIAFDARVWRECLRVAKPGAFLLAFGGTRTFHRIAVAIEDAGWEIRDCLCWLYGVGFPKSLDIGKAIDKAAGATRTIVGVRDSYRPNANAMRDPDGFQDRSDGTVTTPATPLAELFDGWGTALKPAWEPIIVAMKPLDGTFANNAARHCVAGLNIDGCRIAGHNPSIDRRATARRTGTTPGRREQGRTITDRISPEAYAADHPGEQLGRWPANVILDDDAAAMLDEQTGTLGDACRPNRLVGQRVQQDRRTYDGGIGKVLGDTYADRGGASRFFYCAKASRAERNAGLDGRPARFTGDDGKRHRRSRTRPSRPAELSAKRSSDR
jgi:hypothetical protein